MGLWAILSPLEFGHLAVRRFLTKCELTKFLDALRLDYPPQGDFLPLHTRLAGIGEVAKREFEILLTTVSP